MKKTFLITITLLTSMFMVAQGDSGFGIKGGLNYGANGDYFESASDAISNPDSNVGYLKFQTKRFNPFLVDNIGSEEGPPG